jgi:hypothetical protein
MMGDAPKFMRSNVKTHPSIGPGERKKGFDIARNE